MKRKIIDLICKIGFIKNLLYRLTGRRHLKEKYKAIFKKHRENPDMLFVVFTPTHRNLGDHAIAAAQAELLDDMGIQYTEICEAEMYKLREFGLLRLFNRTKIIIIGGGNLGTLWFRVETMFRDIIAAAPKADIIIFPSTIYYEDTDFGKAEFENSKRIYNSHKGLTLYAREKLSYEVMKDAYNDVRLAPDMVLYLNKCEKNVARNGAVLCLRNDLEKTLSDENERLIYSELQKIFGNNITKTDMYAEQDTNGDNRSHELSKKFGQFKGAELVVTDRLHCMIFCAITGTPCIVVNSKSPKVKGCYEWVRELEYIRFSDSLSDIGELYSSIPRKEFTYDNSRLMPLYEALKENIRELIS